MHDEEEKEEKEEEEEEEVVKKFTWPICARCKAGSLQTRSSTACDMLMKDGVRISRREPLRSGDATPSQLAYDTLCAVYPEAFKKQGPWPNNESCEILLSRAVFRKANQASNKLPQTSPFV